MTRLFNITKVLVICIISMIMVGQTENFAYSDNKLFFNDEYIESKNNLYTEDNLNYVNLNLLSKFGIKYEYSQIKSFGLEIHRFNKKLIVLLNEKIVSNSLEENSIKKIDNELYIAVKELKNLNANLDIKWNGEYKLIWITDESNSFSQQDIILGNANLFGIKNIDGVIEPINATKYAYITFDDGPSSVVTPAILDTLKECNVKATFFVNGVNIPGKENVLKRIVNEGHTIGNHTYSHKSEMYKSLDKFKDEVISTNNKIKEITGVKPTAFRPPYGNNLNQNYKDFLKSQGMTAYYWNIDPGDSVTKGITANQIIEKVKSQASNKKNDVIIILHDMNNKEQTKLAIKGVIKELWRQGFKVTKLKPDVKYNGTAKVF